MIYIFLSRNCFSCATWLSSVENKNWILENYSFILLQFSIGWSYFFETDQCFLIRWFSVLWFTSPKHVSIFFFVFIFCTRTKYCIHFLLMFSTVVVIISFRRMSAMCVTSNIGGCFYCEILFFSLFIIIHHCILCILSAIVTKHYGILTCIAETSQRSVEFRHWLFIWRKNFVLTHG